MSNKKGLGRGLEHLLAQNPLDQGIIDKNIEVVEVLLTDIKPNPYQPRKTFDQASLEELASSIKSQGVFQPILLRRAIIGYEIISGERRFRASKIAGKETIPSIIYNYEDEQMMEVALIENIQREDLTVIEEAKSYKLLIENLGITQKELASKVGKSRSHVTNTINLLNLDDDIITLIDCGQLTMGHAKVLVSIEDKEVVNDIVDNIIKSKLSVRDTEKLVKTYKKPKKKVKRTVVEKPQSNNQRLEKMMREKLETKVNIHGEDKGTIEIQFTSEEDLERLLDLLKII